MNPDAAVLRVRLALVTLLCWSVSVGVVALTQTIGSGQVLVSSAMVVAYAFWLALPILALCLALVLVLPWNVLANPTAWAVIAAVLLAAFVVWLDMPDVRNLGLVLQLWLGGLSGILLCWALLMRPVWPVRDDHPA